MATMDWQIMRQWMLCRTEKRASMLERWWIGDLGRTDQPDFIPIWRGECGLGDGPIRRYRRQVERVKNEWLDDTEIADYKRSRQRSTSHSFPPPLDYPRTFICYIFSFYFSSFSPLAMSSAIYNVSFDPQSSQFSSTCSFLH